MAFHRLRAKSKLFSKACKILHKLTPRSQFQYGSFPHGSDSKESACSAGDVGLIRGSGGSLGEGNGYPPVFLPGKFQGQRNLVGYSPWGCKESETTE